MEDSNLLKFPKQDGNPQPGDLLIAEPFMEDPYFGRSVVLITEHNEEGAFGLILNKPINMEFNQALENAPEFNAKLSLGGPVNKETLHYIHRLGEAIPGSTKIGKGIYWGGDFEVIKELMHSATIEPKDIKLFVGYAGWSPGQLEGEMKRNSWILEKAVANTVFKKDAADLWSHVLYRKGDPYRLMINFPSNPSLN